MVSATTGQRSAAATAEELAVYQSQVSLLTLFPPLKTFVVCFSHLLIFLGSIYANNTDPDQTAPIEQSVQSSYCLLPLKCTYIYNRHKK